ncbi:MAG: helix-turn-helix transcriptional regulator [Clostridia bacterium]|nr:helix-turn-helix transcriptional regulator [Clostridia bacterium]
MDKALFGYTINVPEIDFFSRHMHSGYEILYFIQGEMEITIEGVVYTMRPHDLFIVRPRSYHYAKAYGTALYERFVINFDESELPDVIKDFLKNANVIYSIPENSPIDMIYQNWRTAIKKFTETELKIFESNIVENILLFLKHMQAETSGVIKEKNVNLVLILQYINEHPKENLTAAKLAELFFVSPSWITHSFQEKLNIGLKQYVNRKRVLYAQSLIKMGVPVADVSNSCNYENYSTFYRQYHSVTGHSPRKDIPTIKK